MRIKREINQQRIKKHFAFFPIIINNEIVWLETVEYIQEYIEGDLNLCYWHNIGFINKENEKYYSHFKRCGLFKSNFI